MSRLGDKGPGLILRNTRRPARVAILGQPHWSRHLARLLERHASDLVDAVAAPGASAGKLLSPWAPKPNVLLRVGYRPGAPTIRGIAFDALWRLIRVAHPRARAVFYWLGTDLLHAQEDASAGRLRRAFHAALADEHLATAAWHIPDLAALGIDARFVALPYELPKAPMTPMPDQFAVLTYLPTLRFAFYGGEHVFEVARQFPDVPFRVLGADEPPTMCPPNVHYPGWQRTTDAIYRESSVVLRLVQHDGIGGTALEGLAHGREVIYTYPLPHVHRVAFGDIDAVVRVMNALLEMHRSGTLVANDEARAYVLSEFDEARLTRELAAELVAEYANPPSS